MCSGNCPRSTEYQEVMYSSQGAKTSRAAAGLAITAPGPTSGGEVGDLAFTQAIPLQERQKRQPTPPSKTSTERQRLRRLINKFLSLTANIYWEFPFPPPSMLPLLVIAVSEHR